LGTTRELLGNPERLRTMEAAMRRMAHPEAATRIVDELERLGGTAARRTPDG
jgi:UDP-N-acetylglucosamine:LPS N-acetylglucosamine transferase